MALLHLQEFVKPVLIPSYRILQTEFYEHMVGAGFEGLERGEIGSDARHLSVVEYKVQQSKEKLNVIEDNMADKSRALEELTAKAENFEEIVVRADELHRMARSANCLTSQGRGCILVQR